MMPSRMAEYSRNIAAAVSVTLDLCFENAMTCGKSLSMKTPAARN